MQRDAFTWTGFALIGLGAILLISGATHGGGDLDVRTGLIKGLSLLALAGAGFAIGAHERTGLVLRQALIWLAVALSAAALVTHRHAFASLLPKSEAAPIQSSEKNSGTVTIRALPNGHFIADALVNGAHVAFLVDTGATDIALTSTDAQRIGVDVEALTYDHPVITANGQTFFAVIDLDEIMIGDIVIRGVRAAVLKGDFSYSILGMSFLKQLSSFTVDSDRLVMRQ